MPANEKALGAQYDPDLIALDNGDVVVAWTDASAPLEGPTVIARQFDANLAPLGGEQVLGGSSLPEGNVALTRFAGSWAASWREAQVDGSEVIVVFFAGARWTIAVAQPGPASDRPALMALDDEHLFVGYTVGTDPLGTGTAATPRLEAAVVDTFDSSVTLLGPVEPLDPDYSGTAPEQLAIGQRQPAAAAVGERFYLAWHSDPIPGDARGEELRLKELPWDAVSEVLSLGVSELPLPRSGQHGAGNQQTPALLPTGLNPEGALLMSWTDYGLSLDEHQAQPDVVAQLAPVPVLRIPPKAPTLIDDLEDSDGFIVEHEGRQGEWFTYNDGTPGGTQSPPASAFVPDGPSFASTYAARTTGSGFSSWGAGMGLDLNHDGTSKLTYDARGYAGITFWARAAAATNVRVGVPDANTDPEGGVCVTCSDHFGVDLTLGTTWQEYSFSWGELQQQGWGDSQPSLDVSDLYGLIFQVGPNQSFDVWVDDVAFVPLPDAFWLIDGLEDGDDFIMDQEGRSGQWYAYNDGTGSQTPPAGPGNFAVDAPGHASDFAARTVGSGFSVWGAGIGLDLNDDGSGKQTYDASDSLGVIFWARAASPVVVRFSIGDVQTDPAGGVCSNCSDHHGIDIALTTSWASYAFTWAQLAQQGWGDAAGPLDPTALYSVQFQVGPNTGFDFWIDEVSFIPDWTELVDDLEDGDGSIIALAGRQGDWLTYNDGSLGGSQTPAPGSPLSPSSPGLNSTFAARTFGSGFSSWGAGLTAEFNASGGIKSAYDASDYIGVSFWARATSSLPVRFMVADGNTDPDGGVCSNCFDHFGADITLGTSWQRYTFTWWQLEQQGWGDQFGVIDIERLFALHLQTPANQSFDVWVDDVELILGGGPL